VKTVKRDILSISGILIVLVLLLPVFSFADANLEELDSLIKDVNKTQSTPEKLRVFEDNLAGYFYEVDLSVIQGLLKEFSPGDTLALLTFVKISGKGIKDITSARKDGMNWDKVAEKFSAGLDKVVKRIKAFRRASC